MGLDNGFTICRLNKKMREPEEKIYCWFASFHELDNYAKMNFEKREDETYSVTEQNLKDLLQVLEPVYEALKIFSKEELERYENVGFPDNLNRKEIAGLSYGKFEVYSNGYILRFLRLYHLVKTLIFILQGDPFKNVIIGFISSW